MTNTFQAAIAVLVLVASAHAADLAVLRNGNSIRHERRQVLGAVTRLYLSDSSSGYIEIPTSEILRFEADTAIPVPPAPARPPVSSPVIQTSPAPAIPPAQASAISRAELNSMVAGAGQRHQIDPDFISSVIRAESGFHSNALSKKGAQGLMQLMPGTASDLGVANPFDPNSNVEGGTKYLRQLLEKYDFDPVKALAAYNAGATRVDKYHGVPPYYETQAYIARIIRDYNRRKIAENPALGKKSKAATKTQPSGSSANAKAATPAQHKPSRKASVSKAAMASTLSPEPSR